MILVGYIDDEVLLTIGKGTYLEESDEYSTRLNPQQVKRLIKLLEATLDGEDGTV